MGKEQPFRSEGRLSVGKTFTVNVSRGEPWLREGAMDEVFGQDYQTTGLSRALRNAYNGR